MMETRFKMMTISNLSNIIEHRSEYISSSYVAYDVCYWNTFHIVYFNFDSKIWIFFCFFFINLVNDFVCVFELQFLILFFFSFGKMVNLKWSSNGTEEKASIKLSNKFYRFAFYKAISFVVFPFWLCLFLSFSFECVCTHTHTHTESNHIGNLFRYTLYDCCSCVSTGRTRKCNKTKLSV